MHAKALTCPRQTDSALCKLVSSTECKITACYRTLQPTPCACFAQAYKNYANMIIWRTNSITGVRYRDDPTILAFECSNEPHTTDK